MRNTIFLIVCGITLWGTFAPAQPFAESVALREAIGKAEDLRIQGKFVEAFRILAPLKPIGAAGSLERAYSARDEYTNEYYLKDDALHKLVHSFLADQQSERAALTAQRIANRPLRNMVLYEVLFPQCRAAVRRPQEFEQMMAKAEKTAAMIVDSPDTRVTELYGDRSYEDMTRLYISFGYFDRAMVAMQKIKNIELYGQGIVSSVTQSISTHKIERTLENEKLLRTMTDLIQSPLVKAQMLCAFAAFYDYSPETPRGPANSDDAVCMQKRFVLVREATDLLEPLFGKRQKNEILLQVFQCHFADGRTTDANIIRESIIENLLNRINTNTRTLADQYSSLFSYNYSPFSNNYPVNPFQPDQPTELDWKLYEEVSRSMDKVKENDAYMWRHMLIQHYQVVRQWAPAGSRERTEIFDRTHQAVLTIVAPFERADSLLSLADYAELDRVESLLDEATEIILEIGSAAVSNPKFDGAIYLMQSVFSKHQIDRMLELVHSPRIPDAWKQRLYYHAAQNMVYREFNKDSESPEFRDKDFYQLYDLLERPDQKCDLLNTIEHSKIRFTWPQPIEEVIAVSDSHLRNALCRVLIIMNCEQKTGVDVMPLLEVLEKHAVSQTQEDVYGKGNLYMAVFGLAYRYSLWDKKKIADWLEQYEAVVAEDPNVRRFDNQYSAIYSGLHHILNRDGQDLPLDDAEKNFLIDLLLDAARKIPEQNYYRMTALYGTARLSVSYKLPDRAREIINETLAYGETLPNRVRRLGYTGEEFRQVKLLHDELMN